MIWRVCHISVVEILTDAIEKNQGKYWQKEEIPGNRWEPNGWRVDGEEFRAIGRIANDGPVIIFSFKIVGMIAFRKGTRLVGIVTSGYILMYEDIVHIDANDRIIVLGRGNSEIDEVIRCGHIRSEVDGDVLRGCVLVAGSGGVIAGRCLIS